MSDSNRMNLAFVAESTWGTTPSGPPTFTDLRFTSESLGQDTDSVTSQEIRSDRQIVDLIRTGVTSSGDLNFEMSYGAYDDFLEALLYSAGWSTATTVASADTAVTVTDNETLTHGTGWDANPTVGQWIQVSGFTETENNGWFKVASVTGTVITVEGTPFTAEAAGDQVTISQGAQIVNGTTETSFSVEKEYTDLSNTFAIYTGLIPSAFSLNIGADTVTTGSFSFLGKTEASAAATAGDGSNTAAPTNDVLNGIDGVDKLLENHAALDITAFTCSIENNLRSRLQVGTLGPISIGAGTVGVTGTIQAYFTAANEAALDKYLGWTATSLAIVLKDASAAPSANAYVIEFPQVKLSAGRRVAGGLNQDIILDLSFTAYRESTEDVTVRIVRFPAA